MRELRALLKQADLIICADGGLRTAHALRLPPHVVIGDFDSADRQMLQWAQTHGSRLIQHPAEKDKTDTELALDLAVERGAGHIDLLGVVHGRVDHTLANVGLLVLAASRGVRARILHGRSELFLARTDTPLHAAPGDRVSLLPLSDTVDSVTTRGLKYPLAGGMLRWGSTLGISNEVTALPASVRIARGTLLVVLTHRRESARWRSTGAR